MSPILLLFLAIGIITPLVSQNIRSLQLSEIMNMKYQCTNAGCSPPMIISTSTLRDCQLACLMHDQCWTTTFYESMNQCELFTNSDSEYGTFVAEANAISVISVDKRPLFPRSISNWVVNGDAEEGPCLLNFGTPSLVAWNSSGVMTQLCYNASVSDISYRSPGPSNRGNSYFTGQQQTITSMWQIVNITPTIDPLLIDNQLVRFNLSAWLGGFSNQNDYAKIFLTFMNQTNQPVSNNITLGPVLANDRGNKSSLVFRQTFGLVPSGARLFKITVNMTRVSGPHNNAATDNIVVNFSQ